MGSVPQVRPFKTDNVMPRNLEPDNVLLGNNITTDNVIRRKRDRILGNILVANIPDNTLDSILADSIPTLIRTTIGYLAVFPCPRSTFRARSLSPARK